MIVTQTSRSRDCVIAQAGGMNEEASAGEEAIQGFPRVSAEERRIRRIAEIFGSLPASIHGRTTALYIKKESYP